MSIELPPVHQRLSNAGTLPRFVLLIILFVGIAMVITANLIRAIGDPDGVSIGCALAGGGDPGLSDFDLRVRMVEQQSAFEDCVARSVPALAWWWEPVALLLLMLCAVAVYWVLPVWKGRRSRVVPVERVEGSAELVTVLAELVAVAGVRRPPRFVIAPAVSTTGAVVFGRLRHYTVCLDGGLVARRNRDPEGFRAVVLHELAHLRNRDVDITYATVALWRVLLGVVVPLDLAYIAAVSIPDTAGGYMADREQSRVVHHVAMLAVTVILVYLARADILRTREFHADLTAQRWGAEVRLWESAAGPEAAGRAAATRSVTRRLMASTRSLWHIHPSWEQRLRSLADPGVVFVPRALPFFLTGATAAIAASRMPAVLSLSGVTSRDENWAIAVVVAVLVTTISGLLLWPAATHAALTSRPAPSGLRAGCWLAIGLIVGELAVGRISSVWDLLPGEPVFLLLPALAGLAATWWTAEYAQLSATRPAGTRGRWPVLLGFGVSCFVLTLWWHWWEAEGTSYAGGMFSFSGELIAAFEQSMTDGQGYQGPLLTLAPWIPTVLTLSDENLLWTTGTLWVLPLLTWLPGRSGAIPPRPVLPAVGIASLCAVLAVVGATAGLRLWSSVDADRIRTHLLSYTTWLMVVVLGVMWLAAGITAALADRLPLIQGLVVAGVAGLTGLATFTALASVDGCARPLAVFGSSCRPDFSTGWELLAFLTPATLGLGVFLAVVVAALGTLVAMVLRRLRARTASVLPRAGNEVPVPVRPGRWALRCAAVLLPCLAMTALTATVTVLDLRSPASAPVAATGLTPANSERATSPEVRAAQIHAWRVLGGAEQADRILDGLLDLAQQLDKLFAAGSSRDWALIGAEIRPRCATLLGLVDGARRYFSHPDPRGQQAWEALLTRTERIGDDCVLAIERQDLAGYLATMKLLLSLGEDLPGMAEAIFP